MNKTLIITSILTAFAASSQATTVLIDFAGSDRSGATTWNTASLSGGNIVPGSVPFDVNTWSAGGSNIALKDTTNTATGWTFDGTIITAASSGQSLVVAGSGGVLNSQGPISTFGDNGGDGSYIGLVVQNGSAITYTFSGLQDGYTYNLLGLLGTSNTNASNNTISLTTGAFNVADAFYHQNSGSLVTGAQFSGVTTGVNGAVAFGWNNITAAGGVIEFTLQNNTGRGDLQAISLTAVPEPSASAFLGLGGLALILRRRK